MTPDQFIQSALRTESNDFEAISQRLASVRAIRLLHAGIGKATEAAEILDQLKKHIFYGKELDVTNLIEETGDGFWYDAILLDELKSNFPDVMSLVIDKLRARYPQKFSSEAALNRDLVTERKILEGGAAQ